MKLRLFQITNVKTITRTRLVFSAGALAVAILFGIGVFMYGNFGNSHDAIAALSTNMGFENGVTGWTSTAGTWATDATTPRSGTKSVKLSATTSSARYLNTGCTIDAPGTGTNYITVMGWARGTTTFGRAKIGIYDQTASSESVQVSQTSISSGVYTMFNYTIAAINGHTYYPVIYGQSSSGILNLFFDDIMMYTSTSSTTDQVSPTAPTTFTTSVSGSNVTLNFTQGSDLASGIDGILILRQSGIQAADQTVNNQTTYSTTSTTGPTTAGSYSVVYNGAAVSTYTDAPGTGSFTYLVYMRDKAYNYTAATLAGRVWVFNSASTTASITASSSIDNLYIPSGNTLTIGSAATLTIKSGAVLSVGGTLKMQGSIINNGAITFANGSTFDFNRNGSASVGTGIPTATWSSGSTCYITGVTSTVPSGTGQTFHHFTWNCLSQSSSVMLSTSFNANGNVNFLSTGSTIRTVWFDGITHLKGDVHSTTSANFNFDYGSTVYLDGTSLQNIDNTGAYLWFENVIVDNAAGVKLLDDVLCDSVFTLRNGNVNQNGNWWELEDMAQVVRENGTVTSELYPWNFYDLTYKNAVTAGEELVDTYTDAIYRLNLNLSGTVTLSTTASINHSINFTSGKLATGSYEAKLLTTSTTAVTGYSTLSYIVGNLRRNLSGTGAYVFPVGSSSNYELITVTFVSQTGISNLLGYFNTTSPGTPSGITVNGIIVNNMLNAGYWTLTPNSAMTGGTYTATGLMQGYTNTGLNSNTKYYMLKRANSSSAWAAPGTQNLTSGQVSGSPIIFSTIGLSGFSDFGAGYGGGSTLPITLSSFTVNLISNEYADLNWITSAELNNAFFEIQRSADGQVYQTIGKVNGHGTSLVMNQYSFKDESPLSGTSYYRLKQVDFDDQFSFSPIQSIFKSDLIVMENDVTLFPVPATTVVHAVIKMSNTVNTSIELLDISGRILLSKSVELSEGMNQISFELSEYGAGMYFIRVNNTEGKPVMKRFVHY